MRGAASLPFLALLAGCVTSDLGVAQEFDAVARNCEIPEARLRTGEPVTLVLPRAVYEGREAEPAAGRIACIRHWASERGMRLELRQEH